MAYGLRVRIEYKDINEVLTQINIYQDGYSGTADVRYATAGLKIDWGDSGAENLPIIYGSSCTIYFDSEFDYEFLYLFSADSKFHMVEIVKAGSLLWKGFIEPDTWSEPLISTPYPVECTAYDGLGLLSDIDWVDGDGVAYEGQKTLMWIIQNILTRTGYTLPLNTAVELVESTMPSGYYDWFEYHKVNSEVLSGKTCDEVLRQLLQGCRILQRNGEWWIISDSNMTLPSFGYYRYTGGGVDHSSTGTASLEASAGWWLENETVMDIRPAIRNITVKQDYGYQDNLIDNGSFDEFNATSTELKSWMNLTCEPQQKQLNDDGDKYIFLPGRSKPAAPQDLYEGIRHTPLFMEASDSTIKFSLKYALMGSEGKSCHMFIGIRLQSADGLTTYYLRQLGKFSTKEVYYEWGTERDYRSAISCKYHYSPNYDSYGGDEFRSDHLNPDGVEAYPFDKVVDHFQSLEISVPPLPCDGYFHIYLWKAWNTQAALLGACFTAIKLELLQENEESYPTTRTLVLTNNSRNNYVPEDVELMIGDVPDIANRQIIYKGG